jgi:hypothetical protein
VRFVVTGIVNHIQDHLACFAELHWMKGGSNVDIECLMEDSPTQPPMIATACETKVRIVSIPGKG